MSGEKQSGLSKEDRHNKITEKNASLNHTV